ncbi:MAG TPA: MBL fold metallo-hydrolase [Nitrospiria bacterium]|jgi:glyoxylase-like metal-dependent hydrolase (beta-lactamase superfamily II)|nr:MBL fold metallo-hydrolase [Nitrospiria bacterium]
MTALEDDFCDIIKKARTGQGRSLAEVAQEVGRPETEVRRLESGERPPTGPEVRALGEALGLRVHALEDIAIRGWRPKPPGAWVDTDGPVVTVRGDYGGYAVKGYICFDPVSREAVLIDTAYDATEMLAQVRRRGLRLTGVCLTHGHADHAGGLDRIVAEWPVPVYLGEGDRALLSSKPPEGLLAPLSDRTTLWVGTLKMEALATPGHTLGGYCYRVSPAGRNFCFVGDTLFAGSIGRSNPPSLYPVHLASVREKLLALPEDTVLFPGHGPATTAREQMDHNPFA